MTLGLLQGPGRAGEPLTVVVQLGVDANFVLLELRHIKRDAQLYDYKHT